jgi:hypothetical protein
LQPESLRRLPVKKSPAVEALERIGALPQEPGVGGGRQDDAHTGFAQKQGAPGLFGEPKRSYRQVGEALVAEPPAAFQSNAPFGDGAVGDGHGQLERDPLPSLLEDLEARLPLGGKGDPLPEHRQPHGSVRGQAESGKLKSVREGRVYRRR